MSHLGRMVLGLAAVVGMVLAASCSNPASPPSDNTAPTISFYDLQTSGAGTAAVNGYYQENGSNESQPKYEQVSGTYFLYYFASKDFGVKWAIHTTTYGTSASPLADVSYHADDPTGTWSRTVNGATPPPTVARAAITGNLASGSVLAGTYNYSDAESDADASTYQWKRYGSSTATTGGANCTGSGATSLSYTVDTSDVGFYLRLQVTPGDARGATGAPVQSGSVRIN